MTSLPRTVAPTPTSEGMMAKTFMQMASEAMAEVPGISPEEARRQLERNPNTLLVDVRDRARIRATGMATGAVPISAGTLPVGADQELPEQFRDQRLQDRSRPVITICDLGPMSAISARTLKEMGFADVAYVQGGTQAWKDAGLPLQERPPE
jgi:rhodanese-related sulfurtransferase